MTRLLALAVVMPLVIPVPRWDGRWTGTVNGHAVTCRSEQVGFGNAFGVDIEVLWCRGAPRRAVWFFTKTATDRSGRLETTGQLCRRGPRPGHRHAGQAGCCNLADVAVAGDFVPAAFKSPVGAFLVGDVTELQAGVACRHRVAPRGAVVLRRD